jgi:hypothetical protein
VEGRFPDLLAAAVRPASTRLTCMIRYHDKKEAIPARSEPAHTPGAPEYHACRHTDSNQTLPPKPGTRTISNQARRTPESSRLVLRDMRRAPDGAVPVQPYEGAIAGSNVGDQECFRQASARRFSSAGTATSEMKLLTLSRYREGASFASDFDISTFDMICQSLTVLISNSTFFSQYSSLLALEIT